MAAVMGSVRQPASKVAGEGHCDLLIYVSDKGGLQGGLTTQLVCNEIEKEFPTLRTVVAYPSIEELEGDTAVVSTSGHCRLTTYASPGLAGGTPQVRTSQEYKSAFSLSQSLEARACLLLSSGEGLSSPQLLSALVNPVLDDELDLVVSSYQTGAFEGMVNSGILYPLSRVISGSDIRYPLASTIAVSANALVFLLQQRLQNQSDQAQSRILWPTLDLVLAGLRSGQVPVGPRIQSMSGNPSLGDLMTDIVGSLFSEIELKASSWQRHPVQGRKVVPLHQTPHPPDAPSPDTLPLVESFKLGSKNLQEIWRLVLPPQSLLALKRLAQLPASEFQMPDTLWVRIVYDFLLAHRSRNLSRKHLLGALTPLYLGWVASYVMDMSRHGQSKMEERIETLAGAFEADRSYLVSQWRWPDRFNP